MVSLRQAIITRIRIVIGVLAVICLVSIAALIAAGNTPAAVKEVTTTGAVKHSARLDYSVALRPGLLYPRGVTVGTDTVRVITPLFKSGTLRLADTIDLRGATASAGTYWAALRVVAGDLWSKEYQLLKQTALDLAKPGVAVTTDLPLPLLLAEIAGIEKEISLVSSTGDYTLEVALHTKLAFADQPGLDHEFVATFPFNLTANGAILEAPPELTTAKEYRLTSESVRPGMRTLFGRTVPVAPLRLYGWIGLAASGLPLLALAGVGLRRRVRRASDPSRPYRDKLVRVLAVGAGEFSLAVRVGTIKELARIADESLTAMMELVPGTTAPLSPAFDALPTPALNGRKYFVISSSVMYYVV